jgi:hypothetical protein
MNGSASQLLINNNSAVTPAISAPNALLVSFPSANVTATKFVGDLSGNAVSATNSTNAVIGTDNASTLVYPTFVKTSGAGNKGLFIDDTTTPLSYNPSTGALTATKFVGDLSGNAVSATNATLINITSTPSTNATYYPTFVSTTSSNNILRVDSLYLQYNPSTNIFQNPNFLVSDGTETTSTGGLLITTGGVGSKTIYSNNSTGATNNSLSIQTVNTGNSNSSIYDTRTAGSGSGGTAITAFPSWSLTSNFFTPLPVGTPYSNGNFYMLGSCCNMATTLTPNGSESGVVAGFQTSIGDNNGYADMYYNPDQYGGTSPYILRINSAGLLAYGTGTSGQYAFGTPNPTLANTYFSVNNNGTNIANSLNAISIGGNPFSLNFQSVSFRNFYNSVNLTTAFTIASLAFSNPVAGGSYMVYLTTGVGGSITFPTGLSGVKTTFSSNFTIPASSVGVMSIYYINSVYIVGINILT